MLDKFKDLKTAAMARVQTKNTGDGGRYLVALDIGTEYEKALIGKVVGSEIEIIGGGRAHQGLSDMEA